MATENNPNLRKDFCDTLFVIGYLTDPPALRSAFQVRANVKRFYFHNTEACQNLVQKYYSAEYEVIKSYQGKDGGNHPVSLTIDEYCIEMIAQNLTTYYNELIEK